MSRKPRRHRPDKRDPRAAEARRWLATHAGPVQEQMSREEPGLYLINDFNEQGEEIVYCTRNDEMIVDYYDRIQTGELLGLFLASGGTVGGDGGELPKPGPVKRLPDSLRGLIDGGHRPQGLDNQQGGSA